MDLQFVFGNPSPKSGHEIPEKRVAKSRKTHKLGRKVGTRTMKLSPSHKKKLLAGLKRYRKGHAKKATKKKNPAYWQFTHPKPTGKQKKHLAGSRFLLREERLQIAKRRAQLKKAFHKTKSPAAKRMLKGKISLLTAAIKKMGGGVKKKRAISEMQGMKAGGYKAKLVKVPLYEKKGKKMAKKRRGKKAKRAKAKRVKRAKVRKYKSAKRSKAAKKAARTRRRNKLARKAAAKKAARRRNRKNSGKKTTHRRKHRHSKKVRVAKKRHGKKRRVAKRKHRRARYKVVHRIVRRKNPEGGSMLRQWTGYEGIELGGLAAGGAIFGAVNGLAAKIPGASSLKSIPVVGSAILPLLIGAVAHKYLGGKNKYLNELARGLIGASVVGMGVNASQLVPFLKTTAVAGVDYTRMGAIPQGLQGVDFTLNGESEFGASADFGRDADFGALPEGLAGEGHLG